MNDPAYLPFARLSMEELEFQALPEEVREALENRKDEIHSSADLRDMADDLIRRR